MVSAKCKVLSEEKIVNVNLDSFIDSLTYVKNIEYRKVTNSSTSLNSSILNPIRPDGGWFSRGSGGDPEVIFFITEAYATTFINGQTDLLVEIVI